MQRKFLRLAGAFSVAAVLSSFFIPIPEQVSGISNPDSLTEAPVDAKDIKLPAGFSARILGSELGAARHIAMGKNGDIYVKLSKLRDGKGIYHLKDTDGDGVIDEQKLLGIIPEPAL